MLPDKGKIRLKIFFWKIKNIIHECCRCSFQLVKNKFLVFSFLFIAPLSTRTDAVDFFRERLWNRNKSVSLHLEGKSYTTSSRLTSPGTEVSKVTAVVAVRCK